jgi:hypothetical protein
MHHGSHMLNLEAVAAFSRRTNSIALVERPCYGYREGAWRRMRSEVDHHQEGMRALANNDSKPLVTARVGCSRSLCDRVRPMIGR